MNEDGNTFRESMSKLAGAVSVVTSDVDGRPWVTTISSCCSISMDPPLVMVSLDNNKVSRQSILKEKRFNVHILSSEQESLARFGAKPNSAKFLDDFLSDENIDKDVLKNESLASIECELYKDVLAGDHTIFIGSVKSVKLGKSTSPLLYYNRNFGTVTS